MKGLLVALLMCAGLAQAATLVGDGDSCLFLSNSAVNGAEARDAGLPWEAAKAQIEKAIDDAMGQPTSIVNDEDDAAFVLNTFQYVWESGDDAVTVATNVYETCMKSN